MITLEWETDTTRTNQTGGDARETVTNQLILDAAVSETHDLSAIQSTHPIEDGSDITDHVRKELDVITMEVAISNTPIDTLTSPNMQRTSVSLTLPPLKQLVSGASGKELGKVESTDRSVGVTVVSSALRLDRPMEVYDEIYEIMEKSIPVNIIGTRFGDFDGNIINNVSFPVSNHSGILFTITFKELSVVVTETVDAPSPRVERGRRRRNRGNQTASEADENRRRSFLQSGRRAVERALSNYSPRVRAAAEEYLSGLGVL